MKNKKGWLLLVLSIVLVLALSACGSANDTESGSDADSGAGSDGGDEQSGGSSDSEGSDEQTEETDDRSDWPDRIVVGASSPGGSYYIFGGVMGQLIESELGVTASVQDTGGGVANVQLLHQGEVDLALASNIEASQFFYDEGQDGFVGIGTISNLAFQMVVRADSDIQGWDDLNGKSLGLGRANSSHDIAGRIILDALGIEPGQIVSADHGDLSTMFRDGRLDAMFLGTAYPAPAFAEVDATTPLRLVEFTDAEMSAVQEASPIFGRIEVEAGGYQGQTNDTITLSYWNNFFAPKSIPDSLAYEFARIIMENAQSFKDGHASASVSLDTAFEFSVPLHPGAIQYYEDQGLDVPDHLRP